MTARRLSACPTCNRALDDATRAAMGIRAGELLNAMCPDKMGPHDLDHVLFNPDVHVLHSQRTGRLAIMEYKRRGAPIPVGTRTLFRALEGQWCEVPPEGSGKFRYLHIRVWMIDEATPRQELQTIFSEVVVWLWPPAEPEPGEAVADVDDPWAEPPAMAADRLAVPW